MPCYEPAYGPPFPCNDQNTYSEPPIKIVDLICAEKKAHLTCRAACDMRTIIRRHNLENELTEETLTWIKEHDEFDKKRIEEEEASGLRERTKQQALAKLNLEERRVLGL